LTLRILMVSPAPPTPLKARLYRFALGLAAEAEVHVAFVEETIGSRVPPRIRENAMMRLGQVGVSLHPLRWSPAAPFHSGWNLLVRGLSARESLFRERGLRRQLEAVYTSVAPDVVHVDRARAASLVETVGAPTLIDFTDPIGWYLSTRAAGARGLVRVLLEEEARRAWRLEGALAGTGTLLCFASDLGAKAFLARYPEARTCVIPNPLPEPPVSPPMPLVGTRPRIGFWGNLGFWPNIESLEDFCWRVWPSVRRELPTAALHVAGSRPSARVLRLQRLEGITLHPDPTDMQAFVAACDIAIAPLSICAGISNKILEALAQGIPVVATETACAGLPCSIAREVPVASSPEAWARALSVAWAQRDEGRAVPGGLLDLLWRDLAPAAVTRDLLAAYQDVMGTGRGRPPGPADANDDIDRPGGRRTGT
jgi:glycosyltransferase involved in cell wall biosynthesis